MPLVTIKLIAGRTKEQKRGLAKDITEALVKNAGCQPGAVHIDLIEYSPDNIADAGTLMCDSRPR
jgi:4-oxalocrotonate tautomerase